MRWNQGHSEAVSALTMLVMVWLRCAWYAARCNRFCVAENASVFGMRPYIYGSAQEFKDCGNLVALSECARSKLVLSNNLLPLVSVLQAHTSCGDPSGRLRNDTTLTTSSETGKFRKRVLRVSSSSPAIFFSFFSAVVTLIILFSGLCPSFNDVEVYCHASHVFPCMPFFVSVVTNRTGSRVSSVRGGASWHVVVASTNTAYSDDLSRTLAVVWWLLCTVTFVRIFECILLGFLLGHIYRSFVGLFVTFVRIFVCYVYCRASIKGILRLVCCSRQHQQRILIMYRELPPLRRRRLRRVTAHICRRLLGFYVLHMLSRLLGFFVCCVYCHAFIKEPFRLVAPRTVVLSTNSTYSDDLSRVASSTSKTTSERRRAHLPSFARFVPTLSRRGNRGALRGTVLWGNISRYRGQLVNHMRKLNLCQKHTLYCNAKITTGVFWVKSEVLRFDEWMNLWILPSSTTLGSFSSLGGPTLGGCTPALRMFEKYRTRISRCHVFIQEYTSRSDTTHFGVDIGLKLVPYLGV